MSGTETDTYRISGSRAAMNQLLHFIQEFCPDVEWEMLEWEDPCQVCLMTNRTVMNTEHEPPIMECHDCGSERPPPFDHEKASWFANHPVDNLICTGPACHAVGSQTDRCNEFNCWLAYDEAFRAMWGDE